MALSRPLPSSLSLSLAERLAFIDVLAEASPSALLTFALEQVKAIDIDWLKAMAESPHFVNDDVAGMWSDLTPQKLRHDVPERAALLACVTHPLSTHAHVHSRQSMLDVLRTLQPVIDRWFERFFSACAESRFDRVRGFDRVLDDLTCLAAFAGRADLLAALEASFVDRDHRWDAAGECCRFLFNAREGFDTVTPLGLAASSGQLSTLEWLLQRGANPRQVARASSVDEASGSPSRRSVTSRSLMEMTLWSVGADEPLLLHIWELQRHLVGVNESDTDIALKRVRCLLSGDSLLSVAESEWVVSSGIVDHDVPGCVADALCWGQAGFLRSLLARHPDALQRSGSGPVPAGLRPSHDVMRRILTSWESMDATLLKDDRCIEMLRLALDLDCDVSAAIDCATGTALHWATLHDRPPVARFLLDLGADPHLRCTVGARPDVSALDLARSRGGSQVLLLMASHDARSAIEDVLKPGGMCHVSSL